jgi:hypothetical protein
MNTTERDDEGNFAAEINQKPKNEDVENYRDDGGRHGNGR